MSEFKLLCVAPDEATAFLSLWAKRDSVPADAQLKDMQRVRGGFLFTFASEHASKVSQGRTVLTLDDLELPPKKAPQETAEKAPAAPAPKPPQKAKAVKVEPPKEGTAD